MNNINRINRIHNNDINDINDRNNENDSNDDDSEINNVLDAYIDYIRFSRHSLTNIIDIIRLQELHLYRVLNSERNYSFINSNTTRNNIRSRLNRDRDRDSEDDNMDNMDMDNNAPQDLTRNERHTQMYNNIVHRPRTSRGTRNSSIFNPIIRRSNNLPVLRQTLRPRSLTYSEPILSFSNLISDASLNNMYDDLLNNLTPVPIHPSYEQITNATDIVRFGNINSPLNTTCPITQESFNSDNLVTQILHCGHIFNTSSLDRWFEINTRCPLCRYDIRTYNPLQEIRNPYNPNLHNSATTHILPTPDTHITPVTPVTPVTRNIPGTPYMPFDLSNILNTAENTTAETRTTSTTSAIDSFVQRVTNDIVGQLQSDPSSNSLFDGQHLTFEYNLSSILNRNNPTMNDISNSNMRTFVSLNNPPDMGGMGGMGDMGDTSNNLNENINASLMNISCCDKISKGIKWL